MSPVISGSRLDQLRKLRNRIDMEIQVLEDGERLLAARRAQQERDAEKARKARERSDRIRQAAADLEEAAPAGDVRAWARDQGIPIGDRGRISADLRRQYLAAQSDEGEPA